MGIFWGVLRQTPWIRAVKKAVLRAWGSKSCPSSASCLQHTSPSGLMRALRSLLEHKETSPYRDRPATRPGSENGRFHDFISAR